MVWKRNKDDCLFKRKVAKLVSSYKLGELLQDVSMSTFNEHQTWYGSAIKNLHLCGSWMHLLKLYILWTCLDKLWSCIFSPLHIYEKWYLYICFNDNVCTHCNRDCIMFAQILKKALPTHMLPRWSPHNWSFVWLEDNAKGCVRRCGKNHILGVSSCFTWSLINTLFVTYKQSTI